MKFTRYDNIETFGADTLEILLENEVQNNLPISFIYNEHKHDTSNWLLISIKDDNGCIVLYPKRRFWSSRTVIMIFVGLPRP